MREILFRGKRLDNGEWVEGDLRHGGYYSGDKEVYITQNRPVLINYPVDPETVGQFTGRVDKNGRKVFEGDIISITAFAPNIFVGVVLWDDHDQCYLIVKDPIEQIHIDDFGNYGKPSYYEAIGNIHDNSELLDGERSDK